ncbi:MAG: TetR/AcrR family transcriptional regulator [Muribaculaceae bacterium]|nr:TetR/AcrR family transcriptional regulator [Muribaculaceae bacterium]
MKTGGDKTRQRLLFEAFKLFSTKQYDQVTYNDLENATGLSRGAILYHIKNKEMLFRDVVGMFVFRNSTMTSLEESRGTTLKDTIDNFIDRLGREQREWQKNGITNVNFAMLNIQMSSYTTFPESLSYAKEWYEREVGIWREVIARAVAEGEIRRVDPTMFAEIFENTYLGAAYAGLCEEYGYNVERVRYKLHCLYDTIAGD